MRARTGCCLMPVGTPSERLAAAERGDAQACFELGCDYTNGQHGLTKDHELARRLLRKAAELNPKYQLNIGLWLSEGAAPFARDEVEALSMFRRAAAAGVQEARFEVARRSSDLAAAREVYLDIAVGFKIGAAGFGYAPVACVRLLLSENDQAGYYRWAETCTDRAERRL